MSIQIYLKRKYTYDDAGFCIVCINDFTTLRIFNKLSKFSTIFHREPSSPRPYDIFRGQNRYVTLPLGNFCQITCGKFKYERYLFIYSDSPCI